MKVCEVMVSNPACCRPDTDLAAVTALLWDHNCRAIPVINEENRPVGMITDRDISIALGTRNRRAAEIPVAQVITGKVFACEEDAEIHEALACMNQNHVRRLIIIEEGRVSGILSIDDIVLNIQWSENKRVELSS